MTSREQFDAWCETCEERSSWYAWQASRLIAIDSEELLTVLDWAETIMGRMDAPMIDSDMWRRFKSSKRAIQALVAKEE